ncbi:MULTISPECIES: hypothetical protein [Prauserella salsuginis group]|uniref:ParB/Sulfiredoxin domain-containing protein n=1 Tax=Prauserella salsuginis TaxID=387889 RepID=A0ABW6G5R6_9PSEU|nr:MULTISPECIES: hypothetical protein [Prauserella salsuginis group]MCR3719122.1 hypothetical protein [Prauserella flava]MCR3735865.1 hypothetical protein [Prauserella salsuginis]
MAMTRWPIEEASLSDLVLDPRNVRVREGRGDGLTEAEHADADAAIAKYMLEAEQLMDLVRGILRDGYLDNEIPVVVRDARGLVVLEGNRRVTALKVIQEPSLLAHGGAGSVRRLISRYPGHGAPTSIRVMLAPSEEDAQPLLARLHTGQSKKAWIREQQAIFYHAQLSDEVTVDDLRVRYPAEAAQIPKKIRMGEMREVIRGLRYDDPELRDFVMNSELKMTTFEYAYTPKKIHDALGLAFQKDGLLVSKEIDDGQRRGLLYLLGRLKDKTLNTRSRELIAKFPEHDELAEELRRIVAGEQRVHPRQPQGDDDSGEPGAGGSEDKDHATNGTSSGDKGGHTGDQSSTEKPKDDAEPKSRGPNRGDTKSRLDMDGFVYSGTSAGLRRRFEELGRLDVRDFPNATHDLLRTVLECAIKDYFRTNGQSTPRMLKECVEALSKEFQKDQKMTSHISAIKRTGRMNADQLAGTADSLNTSNHEPDQFVAAKEVHAAWDRLKPILVEIVGVESGGQTGSS